MDDNLGKVSEGAVNLGGRRIREPDFEGPAGRAWRVRPETGDERVSADHEATLCAWVLHLPNQGQPGYSPAWEHYLLGVIHLRPIRGVPPPTLKTPDMGYEMVLAAMDPQSHPGPVDPDKDWPFHQLQPLNFAIQWGTDAMTDEKASEVVGFSAVRVLCRGILPPEGHRDVWEQSVRTTVQHIRDGRH